MLKRRIDFKRLKFILDNLNRNIDVLALVDSENCKIFVKIGVICYGIMLKTPKILGVGTEFYEIVNFLNEKAIKIEDFEGI